MSYDAVVERVAHPEPEGGFGEEGVLLAQNVELWVAVQYPRRYKLIEDANDQWWEDSEDDVIQ